MNGTGIALLTALAFAIPADASSAARTLRLRIGDENVRVIVPRLYEPLLPGSVYPNRREERAPRAEPVVIVERELARRAEPFLLARGLAVAEIGRVDRATVDALVGALGRRLEGGVGDVKLLARRPSDALRASSLRGAALFDPPELETPPRGSPCLPVAIFRRSRDGAVAPAAGDPDCVAERWFRTQGEFPDDAFRDAAEWLAAPTRPRD